MINLYIYIYIYIYINVKFEFYLKPYLKNLGIHLLLVIIKLVTFIHIPEIVTFLGFINTKISK